MSMKKRITIGIILVGVLIIVFLFIPTNWIGLLPQGDFFALESELEQRVYQEQEKIHLEFQIRNKTLRAHILAYGSSFAYVTYQKVGGEEIRWGRPLPLQYQYVAPMQTISERHTLQLEESGTYIIYVEADFRVNERVFSYSNSYEIVVE